MRSASSSDPKDDFAERLRFWRVSQKLTQVEAAKKLAIDRSYLSQVERGRPPGYALRTRFLLEEKLSAVKLNGTISSSYGLRKLPVLSWAQAGAAIDFDKITDDWDEFVPSDLADDRAFGVRLRGDSMEPKFSDGDIAIVAPGVAATNGDVVVANLKNEGVLCKIMQVKLDPSLLVLSSYNPAHAPIERHRDQFNWMFPVASVVKQLRRR